MWLAAASSFARELCCAATADKRLDLRHTRRGVELGAWLSCRCGQLEIRMRDAFVEVFDDFRTSGFVAVESEPASRPLASPGPISCLLAPDRRLAIHLDDGHAPEFRRQCGPDLRHLPVMLFACSVELIECSARGVPLGVKARAEFGQHVVPVDQIALV